MQEYRQNQPAPENPVPGGIPAYRDGLVTGAGATFPAPLYQKWAQEYRLLSGTMVNYQPIGSSGGIQAVVAGTVDFGASDSPMTDRELASAPGVLHLPTCIGGIVPAYRVAGVADGLCFDGPLLADIFLGTISRWNAPRLVALNPAVRLPALRMVPVFRSDGSGTTAIVTRFLARASTGFRKRVGDGKAVRWPAGIGARGNDGVVAMVRGTPGAIGFVEHAYAVANRLAFGNIGTGSGRMVRASLETITAAAQGVPVPADFRVMLTDTSNADGYPIAGFTWILVRPGARPAVRRFLRWCLVDGQKRASAHGYAPLPESVRRRAVVALDRLG